MATSKKKPTPSDDDMDMDPRVARALKAAQEEEHESTGFVFSAENPLLVGQVMSMTRLKSKEDSAQSHHTLIKIAPMDGEGEVGEEVRVACPMHLEEQIKIKGIQPGEVILILFQGKRGRMGLFSVQRLDDHE